MRTLREAIYLDDVNSKTSPHKAIKPKIMNAFYVKEQRFIEKDFVEPDDDVNQTKDTGHHVIDYLRMYKENPTFIEKDDASTKAYRKTISTKIPMPAYARIKVAMTRKLNKMLEEQVSSRSVKPEFAGGRKNLRQT